MRPLWGTEARGCGGIGLDVRVDGSGEESVGSAQTSPMHPVTTLRDQPHYSFPPYPPLSLPTTLLHTPLPLTFR